MAEYIDKNELISKCHPVIDVGRSLGNIGVTLDEIMEIPAVDAVEIVRCKDCTYADYFDETDSYRFCVHINGHCTKRSTEFFCADGERRADNE